MAPVPLGAELFERLRALGLGPKPEAPLEGERWRHSAPDEANLICESREFGEAATPNDGGFTISFGNERGDLERELAATKAVLASVQKSGA